VLFLDSPEQAKADWWSVSQVAQKLGFDGFDFESSHDIFKEHAQLSAYQNAEIDLRSSTETFRYFNLAGLTNLSLDDYQELEPTQWPVLAPLKNGQTKPNTFAQLFKDGQFSHPDGKANILARPPTSRPPIAFGCPVIEKGAAPNFPILPVNKWQLVMLLALSTPRED